MPTREQSQAVTTEAVEDVVARVCFPAEAGLEWPGRIGLEVEWFPIVVGPEGEPRDRIFLTGSEPATYTVLDQLCRSGDVLEPRRSHRGLPVHPVADGGRVTFEPGGVIEHATRPHDTAAGALAEVDRVGPALSAVFDDHSAALACVGIDPWHDVATVPLQLDTFRYRAMAEYLAKRGPAGRIIMRHTCSIQVNIDLGDAGERNERWMVANLLSPLLTATFANSPTDSGANGRAIAWQHVDPTRTGFPKMLVDDTASEPSAQMTQAALTADVLLIRTTPDGAESGTPGRSFRHWLEDGDPDHGWPTVDDLEYHFTTLFHEVRPRGMLELRSVDAVPPRWRGVPVTLVCGALLEPSARNRILDLLEPRRPDLPRLWAQGARGGVADPAFCAVAVEAWSYAMEGASRLPAGYLPDHALALAEEFLERFTLRGRCPADEMRDRLAAGDAGALRWVTEPVPEAARGLR